MRRIFNCTDVFSLSKNVLKRGLFRFWFSASFADGTVPFDTYILLVLI